MAERLTPFFQLLKTTDAKAKIPITLDLMKKFREINEALDRCCQMAPRQPLPGEQLVLMIKFSGSWLCSVNRRRSKPEIHLNTQNLCSYSLPFKDIHFILYQNVHLRKRFFSHLSALQRIRTYILGCYQTSDYKDRQKSVTRFFQTKIIPLPLWKACDFVL